MSDEFAPEEQDPAEQAAAEDGFPSVRRFLPSMRHPVYTATRRHFETNPLPRQQNRSTA